VHELDSLRGPKHIDGWLHDGSQRECPDGKADVATSDFSKEMGPRMNRPRKSSGEPWMVVAALRLLLRICGCKAARRSTVTGMVKRSALRQ